VTSAAQGGRPLAAWRALSRATIGSECWAFSDDRRFWV